MAQRFDASRTSLSSENKIMNRVYSEDMNKLKRIES